ncbi:MAG: hypothetical protein Q7S01_01810 [bacterium]|nr:hypothetical protein [bacterium]
MKIALQTQDQLVLKDGGVKDWVRVFNGFWAALITSVFIYMILSSMDFATAFTNTNQLVVIVGLLPTLLMIFVAGVYFILWACWASLAIDWTHEEIVLTKRGVFKSTEQTFKFTNIASVELTRLLQRRTRNHRNLSVLVHQVVLVSKDGIRVSFGHQSDDSTIPGIAKIIAEFLKVPLQEVTPNLTRWGRKLPPYDKLDS